MKRTLAAFFLLLGCAAGADDAPSVLVQTQPPRQGALPDTLTAYGTATPAINGGMTLSVQAEGRVMRIAVTPGEAVHAGQPLLDFQLSAAASSAYEQAQSALKLARQEQTRTARLLAQQLATRDQQAQADKAAGDAQAALSALEQENGGKPRQTLTAPFDGVVSAVPVAQGDRVQPGVALVTLTRAGGLVVTVGVEPAQRRRLKLGQPAQLASLDGGLDPGEPLLQGKLVRIDKVLNPRTRLVDVDIAPDKGSAELLQGQAFRSRIEVGQSQGWLLPRDAVLDDEQGAYLFQVADGKALRVNVKRIGGDETTTVVDGPLDPARPLVTLGNYQLSDGAAVRQDDAAAPGVGADQPAEKTHSKTGS